MALSLEEVERLRMGFYTDAYFSNIAKILNFLKLEHYQFAGKSGLPNSESVLIGDLEVEMQFFGRRKPAGLVVGINDALEILQNCTGYYDHLGNFVNTYDRMEVKAVEDGELVEYSGNPLDIRPVLKIRGRYKDFAKLETPILGVLSEGTRVATSVFEVLKAANDKEILFFPARFAHYLLQPIHGYAYQKAVDIFNQKYDKNHRVHVSTDGQGFSWGGKGCGTTAHAYIAVFLGDTVEMMLQFARILPAEVPRIALVDFHNDCVETTKEVTEAMFRTYLKLYRDDRIEEAEKYRLFAVRTDTSGNMVDQSIQALGIPALDCGVNARLVANIRDTLDTVAAEWDWLPKQDKQMAQDWCRAIKIVVTGGFNHQRIAEFEKLGVPVDIYGVGSSLLSNCSHCGTGADFTADIVQAKIGDDWHCISKQGRKPADNPRLCLKNERRHADETEKLSGRSGKKSCVD